MKNLLIEVKNTKSIESYDLANSNTDNVGYLFISMFGSKTVKQFSTELTEDILAVLQNAIQSTPIENPIYAAKAALLLSILLNGLKCIPDLDQNKKIHLLDAEVVGNALMEELWMFSVKEISDWADAAANYYLSLDERGLTYELITRAINTLSTFKLITHAVAIHALKAA